MNRSVDLAQIRNALKNKQLVGFKPTGATFPLAAEKTSSAADMTRTSNVGQPKTGRSKIGQGKSGLTKRGLTKKGLRKTSL